MKAGGSYAIDFGKKLQVLAAEIAAWSPSRCSRQRGSFPILAGADGGGEDL